MADAQDLKSWDRKKSCEFESHHRHFLLLGPFEMKYSLVFTDEYPPALAEDFQKSFRDALLIRRSAGGGYANFIFPSRSLLRSRTNNVASPWQADGRVRYLWRIHVIRFDVENGHEVTTLCLIVRQGRLSKFLLAL